MESLVVICSGRIRWGSSMQREWCVKIDYDLLCIASIGALHLLVYWRSRWTRNKRMKMIKEEASPFRLSDEELFVQLITGCKISLPNQRDARAGSSQDYLSTSTTSEGEITSREAEALDQAVGSPDRSLWTAHSAGELDTDEISDTEKRYREAQLKKAMHERVVRDDWPLYRREWVRFGEKIAEGGQAEIYAATLEQSVNKWVPRRGLPKWPPVAVAVKKFRKFNGISQGHNPPGLKSLECKNVCRPTGVFLDDGQLCLVMPRLTGDLRAVIDTELELHSAPPFPKLVAVHIIMQLAMGLKGLHEVGIYHRDLKAGNILVEEMKWKGLDSYRVYISDFESSDDVIGTGFYRAPEVLRVLQVRAEAGLQGRAYGSVRLPEHEWAAADVYSFGMVCYEILTGEVPMIGDKWSDFSMALSGHRPELPPDTVPDGLRIMIERCWHEDPQCRPTPSEIIHHLKRIDNDGVYIPAPMTAGMEFLVNVLVFIFQHFSFLQELCPYQKCKELEFNNWRRLSLFGEPSERIAWRDLMDLEQRVRVSELRMKFHAGTMHQCRNMNGLTHGLSILVKLGLLRNFVEIQLAEGVWMPYVCLESEVIIRQISDWMHRWALRCYLFRLCAIHQWREVEKLYAPIYMEFLLRWELLYLIRVRVLGSLVWYLDMTPAIGIRLLLMPYIGARAHPQFYWRLLYFVCIFHFYAYLLSNDERFKYFFLIDLAYNLLHNYAEYGQAGSSPRFFFNTFLHSMY